MKLTWIELWKASKATLLEDRRTFLRILQVWVEKCAIYYVFRKNWRYEKHCSIMGRIFSWIEFNITRKWKFKSNSSKLKTKKQKLIEEACMDELNCNCYCHSGGYENGVIVSNVCLKHPKCCSRAI